MLKQIPKTEDIEFKQAFIDKYSCMTCWEEFKKYSLCFLRKSIRVNTLKISVEDLKKRLEPKWTLDSIPWCEEGFWITGERRDIGNLPEHVLGYIYVQEAASMIPPLVLDPRPGEIVLDMCAAPGSKTTQIVQMMKNEGLLIANEVTGKRIAALGVNMQRCGVHNSIITNMDGMRIKNIEFDKILVDAPCSGTGTIRKSLKTIHMWNPNMGRKLAGVQKQLASRAFEMLKPGGIMVYSTCTLEPEEDEAIVDFLLEKYPEADVEDIVLDIKRGGPIVEYGGKKFDARVKKCLRLWPQDNDTEGFFVAKIKKNA